MDRKSIIAVALCVLFLIAYRPILHLFGLDRYLAPAAPPVATSAPVRSDTTMGSMPAASLGLGAAARTGAADTSQAPALTAATAAGSLFATPKPSPPAQLEPTYDLDTPLYRATFSRRGARLLAVYLKHYASANGPSSHN